MKYAPLAVNPDRDYPNISHHGCPAKNWPHRTSSLLNPFIQ
ncbi:uncharacterized protein METZ01_LOCUS484344 [marine metagenome]|uniref:Uncharacterized protein n=1 Tax=marine metagenome TaxID=408172 RepID=A0A383CHF3_9ZZZZ